VEAKPWIVTGVPLVAEFFGVSPETIRKAWKSRGMPWRQGAHDLREIMHWRYEVDLAPDDDDDEGGVGGPGSPNLERLRLAKAKIAETDLQERLGELVHKNSIQTFLGRMASTWRSIGERLQRKFGSEAVEIVEGGLSGAENDIETLFGEHGDDSGTDETGDDSRAQAAPA
jgi:phage terminase Nu1 subunit (DNA packaging protein)